MASIPRPKYHNFRPHASVFLLLSTVFGEGCRFSKKNFPPKNLIYIFWRENISYSHFLSLHHRLLPLPFSSLHRRSFLRTSPPTLSNWIPDVSAVAAAWLELLNVGLPSSCLLRIVWWIIKSWNFSRKLSKSKFLPVVGLELLKLGLLGCRLIH